MSRRSAKPPEPVAVPSYPERHESGGLVFIDLIPEPEPFEDQPLAFHRMDLTKGEQAVLWDILQYVHTRLRDASALAHALTVIDFRTLAEKADTKGIGLL